MKNLFRYFVVHPLLVLLLVVVLLIGGLALLSLTQTGTGLLVQLAERALPSLSLDGVNGTLVDRVGADSLIWEKDGIRVEAKQAVFEPEVELKFPLKLVAKQLTASRLVIDLPPSEDKSYEPFVLPDLRLPVEAGLDKVSLDELVINQGETEITIRDVVLEAYTQSDTLYLVKLDGSLEGQLQTVLMQATGEMGLSEPHPLRLNTRINADSDVLGNGELALVATGELQAYQAELKGNWKYASYPEYQVNVLGEGNLEGMLLDDLRLNGRAGSAVLQGRLAWSPYLDWDLQGTAENFKPEFFSQNIDGDITLALNSSGNFKTEPVAKLEVTKLEGQLREFPLNVTLNAELQDKDLLLRALDVRVGDNQLTASGQADEQLSINWKLDAEQLNQLHPDLKGALIGNGMLSGKVDGSAFQLGIEQLSGEVMDYPVDAEGRLALQDQVISAQNLQLNVGDNQLNMNGIADEMQGIDWSLDATELEQLHPGLSGQLKGQGNVKGLLDGSRLALRIDELEGKVRNYQVQAKGALRIEDQLLSAQDLQVNVGENRLSLNGQADEDSGIDWLIDAPDLAVLYSGISGNLKGQGNAKGLLDGSRLALRIDELEGKVQDYSLQAEGGLSVVGEQVSAENLQINVGENRLSLNGQADEDSGIDWQLDAPELAVLHPELSGNLQGQGNAKGLLDGSRLALRIDELAGTVKEYPVAAAGAVRIEGEQLVADDLQINVGDNRVALNGQADEDSGIDWRVDAPELAAFHPQLQGQLKARGNAKGLLDGSRAVLQIAELSGRIQDYPLQAVGVVRVEGEQLSAEDLQINVGENQISLNGQADELSGINWEIAAPDLKMLHPELSGSLQGKGNARGLLDGSRLALQIEELAGTLKDYPVKAAGGVRVEGRRLFADELRLNVGENSVSLNGQAVGSEGISWQIDAPELAAFHPGLRGQLRGNGNARGRLDGSKFEVSVAELTGEVLDYPVAALGAISFEDQQWAADNLRLNVGDNQLSLNGLSGDDEGLGWRLDAPQLDVFNPQLSGELKGNGHVRGLLGDSALTVDIAELEGRLQEFPLEAAGAVRLQDGVLFAEDLVLSLGDNQLTLDGQADESAGIDWQLDAPQLSAIQSQLKGRLRGEGNVRLRTDGSRVVLKVAELKGRVMDYPLRADGTVLFEDQLLSADALTVYAGDNQLRLNGRVDEDKGVDWQLDASDLSAIQSGLNGNLNGRGNVKLRIDGSRVALQIAGLSGNINDYPLQAGGRVLLEDQLLSVSGLKLRVGGNQIVLDGQADEDSGIDWQLDAPELASFHPGLTGQLKGRGVLKAKLDGSGVNLQIEQLGGRVNDYPLQAIGAVQLADQVLIANNLRLNVGRNRVLLDGAANTAAGVRWSVDVPALTELAPELQGQFKGNGKLSGRLDGSQFAVDVAQLSGRVNGFPFGARGGLGQENGAFSVDDLQVSLGQNSLRLDGLVNQRRGVSWRLNAPRLADIDPSLRGRLQGNGVVRGLADGSQLTVQIAQLTGRVMDYPLSAGGSVSLQRQRLSANKLLVNVGENALSLNGVLDEQSGLGWSLNAPKLVQLDPALDGQLKGRGNIKGGLDAALITLNIAELNGRVKGFPVNALGTVQLRDKKQLQLSNLRLNVGANAVRLNGPLDQTRGIDWQLDANKLVQLNPELDGQLRGNGNIKGSPDGSRFTVRVNTVNGRVKQYPVQLSGEVSTDGKNVTARNVLLNSGQNTVRLNGDPSENVGLNWQLDARNIGQLVPGLKASARGNGTISGQLDGPDLTVQVARLSAQVDGRPLAARGSVRLQGEKISLADLQVSAGGNNQLALNGAVSGPLNLSWKINGRDLAQAWPGLAGGLQGEGTVRGTLTRPQVKGFLKGSNVRYQDLAVQALDISISQNGADYDVQGVLRNVKQGENVITYAEIKGQGTPERHSGTLAAVHKDGKLNASVSGGLNNGQWNGAVNTLALRDTVAGDWQLTAPIRISASDKVVTVTHSCLANRQDARLCTQANWSAGSGLVAKGQLQQMPLAMARPFLPDNIQLSGRVVGDYQFEQRGGKPFARLNVQLPDSVVVLVSERGRQDTFRYTNARANLVLNDRNASIEAQLDVVGHGQLRTQGTVILSPENSQHRVDLRSTVNMPDITWLQRFSPQVDALQGSVTGDVRVAGLLSKPQVTGNLRLQNGSLYLPETGSRLSDINLVVQAGRADQLAVNGTLRAGSGQLTANGTLRLAQLPNWSADVRITGENLLLMNSHEIQAKVSPDLSVKAGPQSVVITGTVRIPETTVTLRELPVTASVRSDDIVIVGKDRPQPNKVVIAPDSGKPLYIQPNVTIELGERVSFSGFGLDARMTGRMRVLRNRQDIVAEGVLNVVDGVYKAYGQNLKIERGRLLFNGPVDNPGLDVRAMREVENDITVGIAVNGTVETPESTLFSTPPQTQTDTLSYLLTGHALSGVRGAESAILSQAVTGLGLSGGESLAQQLGGSLGLDDVGLSTKGGDYKQSELSLGKRLGPKLYVKYIVGLFDSLQRIAITYDINKKLQLEATSGVSQSVDLIYKINTNRGPFGN